MPATKGLALDYVGGAYSWLDLTALGRQQDWEGLPAGWPQEPTHV